MAYTSVIPVYRLDNAVRYAQDKQKTTRQHGMPLAETVDYALNREKTETDGFESGLGCTTQSAYEDSFQIILTWHHSTDLDNLHSNNNPLFQAESFVQGKAGARLSAAPALFLLMHKHSLCCQLMICFLLTFFAEIVPTK